MTMQGSIMLTEYDVSGFVTGRLLEQDDASSYSGERRTCFSTPRTSRTALIHSYPLAPDYSGVLSPHWFFPTSAFAGCDILLAPRIARIYEEHLIALAMV